MAEYEVGFDGRFAVNADSEEEANIKIREKLRFLDDLHIGYIINRSEEVENK